ncbi:hypothetical protein [Spirosoma pollinicola]|nr:hypothetical protein [Spirosoma pollinicola]
MSSRPQSVQKKVRLIWDKTAYIIRKKPMRAGKLEPLIPIDEFEIGAQ